tara:strand:- start:2458 stop:3192 length:735 start_codon:yes stop_codon:yes gene_type:complete
MKNIEINDSFFKFHGKQKVFFGDFERELRKLNFDKNFKVLYVTDPPYNIGYHYHQYEDNMTISGYTQMLSEIPSPRIIIHYPEPTINILPFAFKESCEKVVQWCYNSNTQRNHRSISFWGIKPDFNRVLQPPKDPNDKRVQKIMKKNNRDGVRSYDWFNFPQVKNVSKEKTKHPCQIPVAVFERIIKLSIDKNEYDDYIIIDPFAGSGSSGVACRNLDIKYIGFDISYDYTEIANKRIGVEGYE